MPISHSPIEAAMKLRYLAAATLLLLLRCFPLVSQSVQWEKTFGPAVIKMTIAIDSADLLYAIGLPESGIFSGWPLARSFNRSTDHGGSWKTGNSPSSWQMAVASDGANSLYLGFVGDVGLYHTTDAGATWSHLEGGGVEVTAIALGSGGELFTGARDGTVNRSIDRGVTWQSDTLETPGLPTPSGFAFASDGSILLSTLYHGIFRSTDAGASWSASGNGIDLSRLVGWDRAPIATTPWGDIYAAYDTILYRSTDNGKNWIRQATAPSGYYSSILGTSGGDLFVGLSWGGGILRSTDRGATWEQTAQEVMPNGATLNPINVTQMLVTRSGTIVAATDSAGLLRTTTPVASTARPMPMDGPLQPVGTVAPNPAGSNASLSIVLPYAGHLRAELVDSYGRRVEILSDGMMREGEHLLAIPMEELSQGRYFCRVAIDGKVFVREVLVMR
jgi:photosystem II stability/assembly factor-like uncharacterized protein